MIDERDNTSGYRNFHPDLIQCQCNWCFETMQCSVAEVTGSLSRTKICWELEVTALTVPHLEQTVSQPWSGGVLGVCQKVHRKNQDEFGERSIACFHVKAQLLLFLPLQWGAFLRRVEIQKQLECDSKLKFLCRRCWKGTVPVLVILSLIYCL